MFIKRRATSYIVLHCADTPASMDIGVEEIRSWHKERGWTDIGYHYVIRRNGAIEKGRPEDVVGSHVRGFNSDSIGICMVGGRYGLNNFTTPQWISLESLVTDLKLKYPDAEVLGHRDLNPGKDCPSFDVAKWYRESKGK